MGSFGILEVTDDALIIKDDEPTNYIDTRSSVDL